MEDIFEFLKQDYKKEYSLIQDVNNNINGGLFLPAVQSLLEQSFKKILLINNLIISTYIDPISGEVKEDRNPNFKTILYSSSFSNLLSEKYNYDVRNLRKILNSDSRNISIHGKRISKDTTLEDLNETDTTKLSDLKIKTIYANLFLYFVAVYQTEQGNPPKTTWQDDYVSTLLNPSLEKIEQEEVVESEKKIKTQQVKLDKVKKEYESKLRSSETKLENKEAKLIEKEEEIARQNIALTEKENQLIAQEKQMSEINEKLIQKENENQTYINEIEKLKNELALPKITIKKSKKITIKDRKVIEQKSIALNTNKKSASLKNANLVKIKELSPNLSIQIPLETSLSLVYDFISHGWLDKARSQLTELEKDYDSGEVQLAKLCLKHKVDALDKLVKIEFDDEDLLSLQNIISTCSNLSTTRQVLNTIIKNVQENTKLLYAIPLYNLALNYNFPDREIAKESFLNLINTTITHPSGKQDEILLAINTYAKFLSNSEYSKFILEVIEKSIVNNKFICAKSLNDELLIQNRKNNTLVKNDLLIDLQVKSINEVYSSLFKKDMSEKLVEYITSLASVKEQLDCLNRIYLNIKIHMHTNYSLAQKYFESIYPFEFNDRNILKEEILTELLSHSKPTKPYLDFTLAIINLYPADQTEIYVSKLLILAGVLLAYEKFESTKMVSELILEIDPKNSKALENVLICEINLKKSQKNITFDEFFDINSYQTLLSTLTNEDIKNVNNRFIKLSFINITTSENQLSLFNNLLRFVDNDKDTENYLIAAAEKLLKAKMFNKASVYLNQALTINNLNSNTYWMLCLCELKCTTLEEATKLKQDIFDNKYYQLALTTAKKTNDTTTYKKYMSFYDSQLAYRKRKKEQKKKTRNILIVIGVMIAIILFNIFLPVVLNHNRYKEAQKLKFAEYSTYCAVYIDKGFEQKEVVVPSSYKNKPVTVIKSFRECESLEKITLPETITEINAYAFYECINLEQIVAPEDMLLETIGVYAFTSCSKLQSVDFNYSNLSSLGSNAFASCTSIEKIDLSTSSVFTIPSSCFSLCLSLKDVKLAKQTILIKQSAFFKCESLESFAVPAYTYEIERQAFSFCKNLKTLEFENLSNLTIIGLEAFMECAIENLTLPEGLSYINSRAFMDNDISYLSLPNSLSTINNQAFFGNRILTLVINFNNPDIIGDGEDFSNKFAFYEEDENSNQTYILTALKIYVPSSSYNSYLNAWSGYTVEDKILPQQ